MSHFDRIEPRLHRRLNMLHVERLCLLLSLYMPSTHLALNTLHVELLDTHSLLYVYWKKSSSVEPGIF
jgi:hypothetical protein